MITITLQCPHCQSEDLVRNGHAPNGKQKYTCQSCGRHSRDNPSLMRTPPQSVNRFFEPTKNAAVCADCNAPSGWRATPSLTG